MPPALGSVERYYEVVTAPNDEHVQLCLVPNGLVVVRVASTHPLLLAGVTRVAFDGALHTDFSGKRKKGAMQLSAESPLCSLEAGDRTALVRCGLRARLLERNDDLEAHPAWLAENRGFVAILRPEKPSDVDALRGDSKRRRKTDGGHEGQAPDDDDAPPPAESTDIAE